MSDTDGKKPLGLGGAPRSGQVKQSFSHGRTKSVVVEVKRKLTRPSGRQAFQMPKWNAVCLPCAPPKRARLTMR
jgi:hypothetical protein